MSRIDRIMSFAFPLALLAIGGVYYSVNPLVKSFPVQCVWRLLTGTLCPACGMQRALHAVVHGHIREAIGYNYFFVVSIPYAGLAVLSTWYNYRHVFDWLQRLVFHRYTLGAYVACFFIWWILRNILGI